ncbi:hypothetical protein ANCCAN_13558 [Ancylostoma caninum]|uniref:Uncharacterized protein n=1 Tax=Ancylostoma caninum TaxID=29170 RepID=A0A368GBV2_ANCCA|nr:hypothetical protein ANCCAN_13558 [Ancylostoma caninum]
MDDDSDLARKQDFLDESVVTIARHLRIQENVLATRFYVKQRMFEDSGKVHLVDIKSANGSTLNINSTVDANEIHHDVAALCRRPKHCDSMFCNLSDFKYFQKDPNLIPRAQSTKIKIGESFE